MRKLKLWIVASASVLLLNLSSCASSSTTSLVAEPVYTEKVTVIFYGEPGLGAGCRA